MMVYLYNWYICMGGKLCNWLVMSYTSWIAVLIVNEGRGRREPVGLEDGVISGC